MHKTDLTASRRFRFGRPSQATGLALIAGIMVTGGLPPHPWTGLLVAAGLAILMHTVLESPRPGRTAWYFALSHQSTLLYWMFLLDPAKSIPTRALVPVQAILTILYVSVFYLAWGWLCGRSRTRLGEARSLLLMPALWTAMEGARSVGELGFPWCLTGSCAIGTPMMPLIRAAGEIGLGCAIAFSAALTVALFRLPRGVAGARTKALLGAATAALWGGLLIGSQLSLQPVAVSGAADSLLTRPLRVAAVQADVALADKWDKASMDSTLIPYAALTSQAAAAGAEFIVWAETAVPAYIRFDANLLSWTRQVVRDAGTWLFAGFPDGERAADGRMRLYNSSGLFSPDGTLTDRYAKHHLLPIGETMPFQRIWPALGKVNVGQAEWDPGEAPRTMVVSVADGQFPFSAMICFESAFGALARGAVRHGSRCLVIITNDGWFGRTAGPRQHAWLARLRAVECGVPVIRCANNGISFICDAEGRVLDGLDLGQRGVVEASITAGRADTAYVRAGSWPVAWFLSGWVLLALFGPWPPRNPEEAGQAK